MSDDGWEFPAVTPPIIAHIMRAMPLPATAVRTRTPGEGVLEEVIAEHGVFLRVRPGPADDDGVKMVQTVDVDVLSTDEETTDTTAEDVRRVLVALGQDVSEGVYFDRVARSQGPAELEWPNPAIVAVTSAFDVQVRMHEIR